jgi:hypothetical protein
MAKRNKGQFRKNDPRNDSVRQRPRYATANGHDSKNAPFAPRGDGHVRRIAPPAEPKAWVDPWVALGPAKHARLNADYYAFVRYYNNRGDVVLDLHKRTDRHGYATMRMVKQFIEKTERMAESRANFSVKQYRKRHNIHAKLVISYEYGYPL